MDALPSLHLSTMSTRVCLCLQESASVYKCCTSINRLRFFFFQIDQTDRHNQTTEKHSEVPSRNTSFGHAVVALRGRRLAADCCLFTFYFYIMILCCLSLYLFIVHKGSGGGSDRSPPGSKVFAPVREPACYLLPL